MGRNLGGTDETFAAMVQRWRHTANLTQEGLAERSGLSPRSIQNLERGRVSRPRRASVRLLADALGLTGADRAAFVHAARLGTPTPITALRGVTDSGKATGRATGTATGTTTGTTTMAHNLRQLVAQAGRTDWNPVDLRGLPHTAAPDVVLERLLTALGIHEDDAVAV